MDAWSSEIEKEALRLTRLQAFPTTVPELFHRLSRILPTDVTTALSEGTLKEFIGKMDPLSIELSLSLCRDLKTRMEREGRFLEAAAIDLVSDRLSYEYGIRV